MQPTATQLDLPPGYGAPDRLLTWDSVLKRLTDAPHYWLATTRPDGRPHVVPVDGVWIDGIWYFGGHPNTVFQRNLRQNAEIALHLDDAKSAVIVEGRAEWVTLPDDEVDRLIATSTSKYGYAPPPQAYRSGVWAVRPRRVLAWEDLAADATRFTFDGR